MRTTILIIFIHFFAANANASGRFYVGANIIYTESKNHKPVDKFEQITSPELSSIIFGKGFEFDNKVTVYIGTNMLHNKTQKRQLLVNGSPILSHYRIRTDYLMIGKRYNRYVPGIVISNNQLKTKSYYKNNLIENSEKHAILYGLNLTSFLNENVSFNTSYIFGNKEFNIDYAISTGLNYNF
jgi:hypothetical protein